MSKAILVIDIDDDLFKDYKDFYVKYDLRATDKKENFVERIKDASDYELKPFPNKIGVALKEEILLACDRYGNKELKECFEEILELENERDGLLREVMRI